MTQTTDYEITRTDSGCVHIYELSSTDETTARDGGDTVVTLVVAPGNAILAMATESIDRSRMVNPRDYGFEPEYPESPETLAAIKAALYAELSFDPQ